MKRVQTIVSLLLALVGIAATSPDRIIKVLPHLLDMEGRHSLSPSLYERDAYQAELRKHPGRVSGIRYDIQWRQGDVNKTHGRLQMELRCAGRALTNSLVLESDLTKIRRHGGWTHVQLDGDAYQKAGKVIAWRARLVDGSLVLAEQRSFLW